MIKKKTEKKLKVMDLGKPSFLESLENEFSAFHGLLLRVFTKPITKALIINIVVYFVLNAIAYARFENDADIMIQSLIYNVAGTRATAKVGFSSALIMKPLCILISILPSISWYTWFIEICAFISITILIWIVISKRSDTQMIILMSVFSAFVGYECYMFPSYIKSSVVGTFTMMMVLSRLIGADDNRRRKFILPAAGLLFNSLLSFTGFKLGLIAGLFIVIFKIFFENYKRKVLFLTELFLVLLAIIFSVHVLDRDIFLKHSDEDKYVYEYIDDVEKLIVLGYPSYDESLLEEYNINTANYKIMSTYNDFYVKDRTKNSMSFIHTLANRKLEFNKDNVLNYFRTVPIRMIKVGYSFLFLIVSFTFLSSNYAKKKTVIWMMVAYIFTVYGIAYFSYAWGNKITQMVAFLPAVYYLLIVMPKADELENKELLLYLSLMAVVLYNNFSDRIITSTSKNDLGEYIESMTADKSITAVVSLIGYSRGRSPYDSPEPELLSEANLALTNGYFSLFPEFGTKQYFSHEGEWLLLNGTGELNPDTYIVCE